MSGRAAGAGQPLGAFPVGLIRWPQRIRLSRYGFGAGLRSVAGDGSAGSPGSAWHRGIAGQPGAGARSAVIRVRREGRRPGRGSPGRCREGRRRSGGGLSRHAFGAVPIREALGNSPAAGARRAAGAAPAGAPGRVDRGVRVLRAARVGRPERFGGVGGGAAWASLHGPAPPGSAGWADGVGRGARRAAAARFRIMSRVARAVGRGEPAGPVRGVDRPGRSGRGPVRREGKSRRRDQAVHAGSRQPARAAPPQRAPGAPVGRLVRDLIQAPLTRDTHTTTVVDQ